MPNTKSMFLVVAVSLLFPVIALADQQATTQKGKAVTDDWYTSSTISAEDAQPGGGAQPEGTAPETKKEEIPWLVEQVDYSGDFWDRPALTGDWGGYRQKMMDNGFRLDASLTQVYQGVISGGISHESAYQGNLRVGMSLDTGHAGLWPGGMIVAKGETRYGNSVNGNTGSFMPADTLSLFPQPNNGEATTALTDLYAVQFLAPQFGVMFGKMSPRENNVFAHDETEQFMNSAFLFDPAYFTTLPISFLGAGVILIPVKQLMITSMVLDSEGQASTSGFDTAFERGTTVFQNAELEVKPFGLTGHQRVGWTWSDKDRVQFEQNPRDIIDSILQGQKPTLATADEDWSVFYDFDQYFYQVPGSTDRGIGIFGRYGHSPGKVNPTSNFYSLGVGGKGMIPCRPDDTFGLGWYYEDFSDQMPQIIKRRIENNEQGVEAYYNIAITRWCHLSPDLQVIDPVREKAANTAVVIGLRLKIDF